MASRGDHRGPRMRRIPALFLLGHEAHTRGVTTKSKDLGKCGQGSKRTRDKAIEGGLEGAQKGRGQQSGASPRRQGSPTSTQPTANGQQTEEGNTTLRHTISILQTHQIQQKSLPQGHLPLLCLARPQLSPGFPAQVTTEKDGISSRGEEQRKRPCPGHLPLARGRQPLLAAVLIKGLSVQVNRFQQFKHT